MKNNTGMLMKSGGKFNKDTKKMDMKNYLAQRAKESGNPMGMSGIGPNTNSRRKSSNILMNT